jgi:transcriptional regulator of arginine metabolism
VTRAYRQARISEILRAGSVPGQQEIARRLRAVGIRASQATLSRDLHEMGVVRGPEGYILAEIAPAPGLPDEHEREIRGYMRSVAAAGTIVVMRTDPGHAHALGVLIDRMAWREIVGTVAGDDTIFIATKGAAAARRLADRFRRMVT